MEEEDDELRVNKGEHPIILWRRFLTLKGNPNKYKTGDLHRYRLLEYKDRTDLLFWVTSPPATVQGPGVDDITLVVHPRKMFESLSVILDLLMRIDDNKDTQDR